METENYGAIDIPALMVIKYNTNIFSNDDIRFIISALSKYLVKIDSENVFTATGFSFERYRNGLPNIAYLTLKEFWPGIKDVFAMEKVREYHGLYHVLHGTISMIDGKTIDDLNINSLFERLDGVKEVIIATNPTREGETTALFLAKLLAKKGIETSRIANGLPIGSNIDYADELTLLKSLEGRKKI